MIVRGSRLKSSLMMLYCTRTFSVKVPDIISNKNLWPSLGYIDGKFTSGSYTGNLFEVKNPATGEIIALLPKMKVEDVNEAAEVSMKSWKSWKSVTAKERSKYLSKMASLMLKYHDDLAKIITFETGKPFLEAKGEVLYGLNYYDFYAEEAKRIYGDIIPSPMPGRRLVAIKQPVGPAALITPWNFPCAMITRKIGAALAAGCTVVLKPSDLTPLSALALCAIALEAGIPPGVINCLTVAPEDTVTVGAALCQSELIRKLSFTGSTKVGKLLLRDCAATVKKVSLELGGNAPFIVFEDANIDIAINAVLTSKFRNAGQACIASNRFFIQENIYEKFVELLKKKIENFRCGSGFDESVNMGPLINQKAVDKVQSQIQASVSQGSRIVVGGVAPLFPDTSPLRQGSFFLPTLLRDVPPLGSPFDEETFGPVIPLSSFRTEEEVLEYANHSKSGLAGYACTQDLGRAWRVAEGLECGLVGINEGAISSEVAPFGGIKESGLGREGSSYGLDDYLEIKYICFGGLGKI